MSDITKLAVCVVVTLVGLCIFTEYRDFDSVSRIMGYPVISIGDDAVGLVAVGYLGRGVLVIGFAGAGVVDISLYGAGVLFGTGQVAAGAVALGQAGLSISMFMGQAGVGLNVVAQGGLGYRVYNFDDEKHLAYFRAMKEELRELFVAPAFYRRITGERTPS